MRSGILTICILVGSLFLKNPLFGDNGFFLTQEGTYNSLQRLQQKIESLTDSIDSLNSSNARGSDRLFTERGIHLLVGGEYELAIEDFNQTLSDIFDQNVHHAKKYVARALWGRTLCYAFLGKVEEFNEDLARFAKLINLNNNCNCTSMSIQSTCHSHHFKSSPLYSKSRDFDQRDDIALCSSFCEATVYNTVKYLKLACATIRDIGIQTTLYIFIEGLGDKAMRCCRGNGFWRDCVDPLVKTADKWKAFGIPSDPYWD